MPVGETKKLRQIVKVIQTYFRIIQLSLKSKGAVASHDLQHNGTKLILRHIHRLPNDSRYVNCVARAQSFQGNREQHGGHAEVGNAQGRTGLRVVVFADTYLDASSSKRPASSPTSLRWP